MSGTRSSSSQLLERDRRDLGARTLRKNAGLPLSALPRLPSRIYDEAMSFSDTIFLFFLALILFGPKKLPEMARQAGKLLAELRRASNEFRSQIETEIAHLEVQKSQTILPPSPPPQGTLTSLSVNPATISPPHEAPDTLAGPIAEAAPLQANSVSANPGDSNLPESNPANLNAAASTSDLPAEHAVEPRSPAAQEPHV
jgi:sec-independent protein translocase protein TatB